METDFNHYWHRHAWPCHYRPVGDHDDVTGTRYRYRPWPTTPPPTPRSPRRGGLYQLVARERWIRPIPPPVHVHHRIDHYHLNHHDHRVWHSMRHRHLHRRLRTVTHMNPPERHRFIDDATYGGDDGVTDGQQPWQPHPPPPSSSPRLSTSSFRDYPTTHRYHDPHHGYSGGNRRRHTVVVAPPNTVVGSSFRPTPPPPPSSRRRAFPDRKR